MEVFKDNIIVHLHPKLSPNKYTVYPTLIHAHTFTHITLPPHFSKCIYLICASRTNNISIFSINPFPPEVLPPSILNSKYPFTMMH